MDLKPENVLVGDDDLPVLCDFNTSLKSSVIATTLQTSDKEPPWMTLLWASPEQINSNNLEELKKIAPSVDSYSVCLLIF